MQAHARRSDHVHNLASDASLQKLDGLDTSLFSRAPPEVRHLAPVPKPALNAQSPVALSALVYQLGLYTSCTCQHRVTQPLLSCSWL